MKTMTGIGLKKMVKRMKISLKNIILIQTSILGAFM